MTSIFARQLHLLSQRWNSRLTSRYHEFVRRKSTTTDGQYSPPWALLYGSLCLLSVVSPNIVVTVNFQGRDRALFLRQWTLLFRRAYRLCPLTMLWSAMASSQIRLESHLRRHMRKLLCGTRTCWPVRCETICFFVPMLTDLHQTTVNIMDTIMFEAQRHGRLSFYMVCACFTSWGFLVLIEF